MYTYSYSVKMFDTDASGFLFVGSQVRMAHEAFESFMESAGMGIAQILRASDYSLPIVRAETDYKAPSRVGDRLVIEMSAERIGSTSFTLVYRILTEAGEDVGGAKTVHVAVERSSRKPVSLPEDLRAAIKSL